MQLITTQEYSAGLLVASIGYMFLYNRGYFLHINIVLKILLILQLPALLLAQLQSFLKLSCDDNLFLLMIIIIIQTSVIIGITHNL